MTAILPRRHASRSARPCAWTWWPQLALLLALALSPPTRAWPAADAAPQGLLISYHVASQHRLALRQAIEQGAQARLKRLQDGGVLESYRLLFSRHADAEQWDALAVIVFTDPAKTSQWAALEREYPAALDAATLARLSAVHSVPVERVRSQREGARPASPVVLAIPYLALVPATDYLSYADSYVIPQFQGWMREGLAWQYSVFACSLPAGRAWSHLILVDYRSDEALAARQTTVAKVRSQLREVPQWRAINESKTRVREEKPAVIADDITAR
jgi:hypothetical protein